MVDQQYRPTLLDVPVSIFRQAFDNVPESEITTLRDIVSTEDNRADIEAIRTEADPEKQAERKRRLRAFTAVARLRHRKEGTSFEDKISQQWPLLMGDVDQKDNLGVDMAEVKKKITRLPYVLLCAYSVRGGLWFILRLPDDQTPGSLAAHFRYVQRLFSDYFGVHLDKGKGGNPTHLRYVSYDDDPFFNETPTVMARTYTPNPKPLPPRTYANNGGFKRQDESLLLSRLVRFTEGAGEGERHTKLLRAAKVAGGYIVSGLMDEQNAVYGLETVASQWPTFSKSQKTIRDGIRYGLMHPIDPENSTALITQTYNQPNHEHKKTSPAETRLPDPNPGTILRPPEPEIERLIVEPCENYPAERNTTSIQTTASHIAGVTHPKPPLFWDATMILSRVRWCVIPAGVEECDYNPTLIL